MEHQIYQFQANILFGKMPMAEYRKYYDTYKNIPENVIWEILSTPEYLEMQKKEGNIFNLGKKLNLI